MTYSATAPALLYLLHPCSRPKKPDLAIFSPIYRPIATAITLNTWKTCLKPDFLSLRSPKSDRLLATFQSQESARMALEFPEAQPQTSNLALYKFVNICADLPTTAMIWSFLPDILTIWVRLLFATVNYFRRRLMIPCHEGREIRHSFSGQTGCRV